MTASFIDRWHRKWQQCGFDDIGTEFVPCGDAVLPDAAAPCLNFGRADRPAAVWQVFGPATAWADADRERLAPFRVIGSDGAGNPVCVEQLDGAVVLLDHEDRFRTRQFVNSGIRQLAECLLAHLGERDAGRFRVAVHEIDPAALVEGSFWWHAAVGLGAEG